MATNEAGNCRSCNAPVLWVRTEATGSLIPLDAEPRADGTFFINAAGKAQHKGAGLFDEAPGVRSLYVSHWATCPDAHKHRKAKK